MSFVVIAAGFTIASGTSLFAQDPAPSPAGPCDNVEAREAKEKVVRENFDKSMDRRKIAVAAGEEYIKTYGSCEAQAIKDFIDYLNGYIPPQKIAIAKWEHDEKVKALFTRFDSGVKASNWDDAYAAGKELLSFDPDNPNLLNIVLAMGSIAYDEIGKKPPNNKYNEDTIKYAKMAIQMINEGKTSKNFGALQFAYQNKENAIGAMNWTISYVTYSGMGNKKDALPYLYQTSKLTWDKKPSQVYSFIGDYYYEEAKRLGDEIKTKTIAAGNKDTDETKALIAQQKAYAERGIDAYARARQITTDAKYKTDLTASIESLYNVRFHKTDGSSEFVTDQLKKPFPDPSNIPAPIVEADADPAAPGSTTASTLPAAPDPTKAPPTTPGVTKKPAPVKGASPARPAAKKPVAKKKGAH